MKLITKIINVFDRLIDYFALMAIVLLVFLMLSITYTVVTRYFLGWTTKGILEIWEYTLLYIPFLGAAWLLKKDGHVSVDIVLTYLKPKARAVLNTITSALGAGVCLTLAWAGALTTWASFQAGYRISGELYPPEFLILMIIPIGSFLLFIQFLRRTYQYLGSRKVIPDKELRL